MIQALKNILGIGPKVNIGELIAKGATIIDVRSKSEFSSGHINGALNIPVDQLGSNLKKLKDKNHPIITCCASGMRSGSAKMLLKSKGYSNVTNAGSWYSLQKYYKK